MTDRNIRDALSVFIEAMRKFTVALLQANFPGEPWEGVFFSRLTPDKQRTWNEAGRAGTPPPQRIDYNNLSTLNVRFRDEMLNEFGGDPAKLRQFGTDAEVLVRVRNKTAHYNTLTDDEREEAFVSMKRIARELQMPKLVEILENSGAQNTPASGTESGGNGAELPGLSKEETSGLTPWFDNCVPSSDIQAGVLDESVFAANLAEAASGFGTYVYRDSGLFFERTYVTADLRDLAGRVVRALNGEETPNRVLSLQTNFGGGKTHALITLFHIAKCGTSLGNFVDIAKILPKDTEPKFADAKIAVFTNDTNDVAQGHGVEPGITIRTLWGEIAYQLGGKDAYEKVRKSDEELTAPRGPIFREILSAAGPSLILVDELADYCCRAAGVTVGDSNLYVQTVSFMQALTETVSRVKKSVLVMTLPASNAEVANSVIGADVLGGLQTRVARVAAHVRAANEDDDIFQIVRQRLFERILKPEIAAFVAKRYRTYYASIGENDLPAEALGAQIEERIKKAYPFHPALIDIFRQRWGAHSKFQRTRGVLRLLASIIQDLWLRRDELKGLIQMLILPADVRPENLSTLTGTIVELMGGANWNSVIATDVCGQGSTALNIDKARRGNSYAAKYRLAQSITSSILLASVGTDTARGLDIKNIKFCVLRPYTFIHNEVNSTLYSLKSSAHFLHWNDSVRGPFRFETDKNVNTLIAAAKADLSNDDADTEILRRINAAKSACRTNVLVAPTDVPEQDRLTFVVMPPKFSVSAKTELPADIKNAVETIALKRGNTDRVHRNTMLFLLCSSQECTALRETVREFLACNSAERSTGLSDAQRKDIRDRKAAKDRTANEALARAFSVVVKYKARGGAERLNITDFAADFTAQLNGNITNCLLENDWLLADRLGQQLLTDYNLFPQTQDDAVPVKEIYEALLRFDDKIMIAGPQVVINTVNRLCAQNCVAVAVGKQGEFTKIYKGEQVPFLDVTSGEFFLVDKTLSLPQPQIGEESTTSPQPPAPQPQQPTQTPPAQTSELPKIFKRITVSGSVPFEQWTQLYTSFLMPLRNNKLEISVSFSAKSTATTPLAENSPTISIVRESASQLGLSFETE